MTRQTALIIPHQFLISGGSPTKRQHSFWLPHSAEHYCLGRPEIAVIVPCTYLSNSKLGEEYPLAVFQLQGVFHSMRCSSSMDLRQEGIGQLLRTSFATGEHDQQAVCLY
eukprot:Gb_12789 [translate_table: standard]